MTNPSRAILTLIAATLGIAPARAAQVQVQFDASSPTGGIQEAVNQLGPEGGTVLIPAGRYVLRAPIMLYYLDKPVVLAGEGPATVLVAGDEYQLATTKAAAIGDMSIFVDHPERAATGDQLWIAGPQGKWKATRADVVAIDLQTGQLTFAQPLLSPIEAGAVVYHSHPLIFAHNAEHVTVRDMKLIGSLRQSSFQGWSHWLGNAAVLIRGKRADIRNVEVIDAPSDAIIMAGGGPYHVRDCRVTNAAGVGIHLGGNAKKAHIHDNLIEQVGYWGVYLCNGAQHVSIANNLIIGVGAYETAKGMIEYTGHVKRGPLDNPGYLRYRWNLGVAGIAGLGGGGDTDRYNTITGNVVRQSRGAGISFLRWKPESGHRPGADFAITGNTIEDVAYAGVHLYAAEGVTISGNTIANAGEGIAVVKARHCAVQNNLLRRCKVGLAIRSMDGWQADGETGPASEQNVITANALFACEMPIDIAADATDNTVDGNHVYPATDADAEASPTASVQP